MDVYGNFSLPIAVCKYDMAKEVINPKPCIQIELYFLAVDKNTHKSTIQCAVSDEKSNLFFLMQTLG